MKKSDRSLTADRLDRLLAALDSDRERAAASYLLLRRRLVGFFEWRGAWSPEECADETLGIAARRLAEGEQVQNLPGYCSGIARMVMLEQNRARDRFRPVPDMSSPSQQDDCQDEQQRLRCLEQCLDELPGESRQLILAYYDAGPGGTIESRKVLARRLGIPAGALRIRVHRIRTRLEDLVRDRLKRLRDDEK